MKKKSKKDLAPAQRDYFIILHSNRHVIKITSAKSGLELDMAISHRYRGTNWSYIEVQAAIVI